MTDATKFSKKLSGQRVLIFGGSSGIGYAIAEASTENGADVIISSSNPKRIEDSLASLRRSYPSARDRITGYPCGLRGPDLDKNIKRLFTETCGNDAEKKLDHIVFTSGDPLAILPIQEITLEIFQEAGMVRFNAPLLVAKYASTYLNPGPSSSITFTNGSIAEKPIPNWTMIGSYAAGLNGMMRGIALDLKPLRCNVISPGVVQTEMWDEMRATGQWEGFETSARERMTTGVVPRPEHIAEAYLYVMKDHNITGSVITTNGGVLLTN